MYCLYLTNAEPPGKQAEHCEDALHGLQLSVRYLDILLSTLIPLQIHLPSCIWIKNFLSSRPRSVTLGPHHSSPLHPTNCIIEYADDTTVVGCICDGVETANRAEVEELLRWCSDNNLTLNIHETKELMMDFRKHRQDCTPLLINGEQVESVTSSLQTTPGLLHQGPG